MKLDNKGFAFSTMLYGVLAVIVVVLTLVFSILKSTKDETFYYSSVIEETLNKCIEEEIALENCYTSGINNCDPTTYYACLGIAGTETNNGLIIAEHLKKDIVTTGNGLYQDSIDTKRYVYRGTDVNNYISYSGLLWRIIGIEADGSVKLIYPTYTGMVEWDINDKDDWEGSSINNYLNNIFYSTLSDTSKLNKKIWRTGRIYDIGTDVSTSILELLFQENTTEYVGATGNLGYIGLLNASDFIRASLDSDCHNNVLNSTTCASWLSPYKSWIINPSGNLAEDEGSQIAYYFDNNKLSSKVVTEKYNIAPVIFLNRTSVIVSGNGSLNDPFILK